MARRTKAGDEELLTLSEVGERTGISMPSLLRYKKEHQDRIPAVGEGRTQRYPAAALPVFEAIKRENLGKRGRPKGAGGGAKARRAAGGARRAAAETPGGDLLTLTEVGEKTGISYPTLRNYVERHGDRIPSVGEGRRRRFPAEAVPVFQELRAESRPGRKPAGGADTAGARTGVARRAAGGGAAADGAGSAELARRLAELAKRQERLQRDLDRARELLTRPAQATLSWR